MYEANINQKCDSRQNVECAQSQVFQSSQLQTSKKVFEPRILSPKAVDLIEKIQHSAAALHAQFGEYESSSSETHRLMAVAKTHLETSVMFATKALSRS